jgi:cysteine desulfurase/selenocysteine lyase
MNEEIRAQFPVTKTYIYMNHSAVSPLSVRARDAMINLVEDVTNHGANHHRDWCSAYERVRASAAQLVNARPHEIAFMRNTSDAISAVANGISWRKGDNVVTCNVEFPANIYPWMRLAEFGVKLKMAREREGRIEAEELLSLIDEQTRVVSISWVQFASGFRSDLRRIGSYCRKRGIIFFVDAIQGLGGLKLDVEGDCVDAFAADAHKYLLGPEGIALLYVSDRIIDQIKPTVVGWMSVKDYENYLDYRLDYREGALRFECGTLNTVGVYGLGAAIDLFLEVGPEKIERYLLGLSDYLAEALESKGYKVVSSRRPGEASAIVTCTHPKWSPRELYRSLLAKNIITAPRAGRLRISPHFYNTREEVDALIEALPK